MCTNMVAICVYWAHQLNISHLLFKIYNSMVCCCYHQVTWRTDLSFNQTNFTSWSINQSTQDIYPYLQNWFMENHIVWRSKDIVPHFRSILVCWWVYSQSSPWKIVLHLVGLRNLEPSLQTPSHIFVFGELLICCVIFSLGVGQC